jgi:hypothetical protein
VEQHQEPEITPEMIEAGVEAAAIYDSRDSLTDIVTAVYRAMSAAQRPVPVREECGQYGS